MGPLKISPLINEDQIQKRVLELGQQLTDRFKGKDVVFLCVLNGSFLFYADLIRAVDCNAICEFIGLSSYGNSTRSSGEVKLTLDLATSIQDKHVVIVEDVIDTGLTMNYLHKLLECRNPKSITTLTLLHKPDAKKVDCDIDFVGFKIPNDFVVGYGLDYQGLYRNLPYIAQVENMN